jgi:hypothetical protein
MASGSSRSRARPFTVTVLVGLSRTFTLRTEPTDAPEITHSAPWASESHPTTIQSSRERASASASFDEDALREALERDDRRRVASACARRSGADAGADEDARAVLAVARRAALARRDASMVRAVACEERQTAFWRSSPDEKNATTSSRRSGGGDGHAV